MSDQEQLVTITERDEALAEVKRLRDALAAIVAMERDGTPAQINGPKAWALARIALAALEVVTP